MRVVTFTLKEKSTNRIMAKNLYIEAETFLPIIESQRIPFFDSLGVKERDGKFKLSYADKNYNCMPYLESVLDSKIQGLSFFSGGGGLDISMSSLLLLNGGH